MVIKLLVVDDEKNVRIFLSELFNTDDYDVFAVANGKEALKKSEMWQPHIILLDLNLPDTSGIDLIKPLRENCPGTEIIVISALGTVNNAVKTIKSGAYDFITKPFELENVLVTINRCLEHISLKRENRILKELRSGEGDNHIFKGEDPAIQAIRRKIEKLTGTDVPILITGETGTGKNILATQIHWTLSGKDAPLIYTNCATLSDNLFESELFGHEKGSFTGAEKQKKGRVEEAEGGTLVLDEIMEIPYKLQAKLLTFLQDRSFYRVGGHQELKVNTRVIALTNRDPAEEIGNGNFRKDLYYRLNVINFHIPPLRERRGDIALLADYFIDSFTSRYGDRGCLLNEKSMKILTGAEWPGNTRELKNTLEQAFIYSEGGRIDLEEIINESDEKGDEGLKLKEQLQLEEKKLITASLARCKGSRKKVAEELGISLRNLHYKLSQYDIDL